MRRLTPITALAALLSFAPGAAIVAQQTAPLAAGERVRVVVATGRQARHTGTVVAVRRDTLVLDRGNSQLIALPLASIGRVERSLGRGWCGGAGARAACMLGGALAGMLVGGGIGYFGHRPPDRRRLLTTVEVPAELEEGDQITHGGVTPSSKMRVFRERIPQLAPAEVSRSSSLTTLIWFRTVREGRGEGRRLIRDPEVLVRDREYQPQSVHSARRRR